MKLRINNIDYNISEKFCALEAVMYLSNYYFDEYPFLAAPEYPFLLDLIKLVSPFKNHSVVELFNKKAKDGFDYHKPYEHILNNEKDDFALALDDFIKKTKLESFLKSNEQYLFDVITNNAIKDFDVPSLLNDFYRSENDIDFEVYFLLGVGNGCGFGIKSKDDRNCSLIGMMNIDKNLPVFLVKPEIYGLIIHEFSHCYINPLIDTMEVRQELIDKYYAKLSNDMKEMYGATKEMIAEQFVRAFTIYLLKNNIDEDYAEKQLQYDIEDGFTLATVILEHIESDYVCSENGLFEFIKKELMVLY